MSILCENETWHKTIVYILVQLASDGAKFKTFWYMSVFKLCLILIVITELEVSVRINSNEHEPMISVFV